MVTLRQIEAFRAVMVAGSVTQAAELLYISQPAVSRMISDLESDIGFKLFVRANRQLIPTEESRILYQEVERAFTGLMQVMRAAEIIREYRTGQLRLVTIPSLASNIIPDLISIFAEKYPGVSVSVEVQPSQRIFEWIVSQQCEIGISTLPVENMAITTESVITRNAVCIMPNNHRLSEKSVITPEDLEGESFVSFKADALFRHLIDDVFQRAGIRRKLGVEARTKEAISGLVSAGLGVSIVSPQFQRGCQLTNLLVKPFKPDIPIDLAILKSKQNNISRISEKFIDILKKYVEKLEVA